MESTLFYPKKRESCKISQQFLRDMQAGKVTKHGFAFALWAGSYTDGVFLWIWQVKREIRRTINMSPYKLKKAMEELKRCGYMMLDGTGTICTLNMEHIKPEEAITE